MTRPEVSIALAQAPDVERIAIMSRDLIEQGLRWSWTPRRVAASVRSPQANVVVARLDSRIVGFGIMRYGDDQAHLDLLGVCRDHQRMGLGRRLIEWLERPALFGGIAEIVLEVRTENHAAQAFYQRLGYRKIAEIRGYYQGRESATRMERQILCTPTT